MTELFWLATPHFVVAPSWILRITIMRALFVVTTLTSMVSAPARGDPPGFAALAPNYGAATTTGPAGSGRQTRGVPAQMIAHEGGDEIVAVVVTGLAAETKGNRRFLTGGLQQFRAKLLGEKRVGIAIVHQ
jgi:hypothetical protein